MRRCGKLAVVLATTASCGARTGLPDVALGAGGPDAELEVGAHVPNPGSSAEPCPNDPPCDAAPCPTVTIGTASGSGLTVAVAVGGGRVFWANNGSAVYAADGVVGRGPLRRQRGHHRHDAQGPRASRSRQQGILLDKRRADERRVLSRRGGGLVLGRYIRDARGVGTERAVGSRAKWRPVYWANTGGGGAITSNAQLLSGLRAGGILPPEVVYTAAFSADGFVSVVVDPQEAYFADENQVTAINLVPGVTGPLAQGPWGLPLLAGNTASVFVQGNYPTRAPSLLAAVSTTTDSVLQLATDCMGDQIAADERFAYCISSSGLERVLVGEGTEETLATPAALYGVATDGTYAYFIDGNSIERVRSP